LCGFGNPPGLDGVEARWYEAIVAFIKRNEALALPTIFALAFFESIAFASLVLPFWGILVALGAFLPTIGIDFIPILAAASIGAALGDWISYSIGYRYQHGIKSMWPLRNHHHLLQKGEKFFSSYGIWAIALARFSGPLRAAVPIIAGVSRMSWTHFQVANWVSAPVWAGVLLVFGDVIAKVLTRLWS
jgi:membrane protein DedA with SNARE-associated domain